MSANTSRFIGAAAAGAIALGIAQSAAAQYRPDQPAVIEPERPAPTEDTSPQTAGAFRSAYAAAGRPRIALFWNVELTDQLADDRVSSTRISGQSNRSTSSFEKTTTGPAGNARLTESDDKRTSEVAITNDTRTGHGGKRTTSLAESDRWQLESAFAGAMREGGVQFIDRSFIMRALAAKSGGGGDRQTVEMQALQGKADMLLEVLMTRDARTPLGWAFKVALKDVESGANLGGLYSTAVPRKPPMPASYRATEKGFERVNHQPIVTVQDIGRTLAVETMADLAGSMPARASRTGQAASSVRPRR